MRHLDPLPLEATPEFTQRALMWIHAAAAQAFKP